MYEPRIWFSSQHPERSRRLLGTRIPEDRGRPGRWTRDRSDGPVAERRKRPF